MKILLVNPIIYTSETKEIKKVNSIKDTMIYDLCLAFMEYGIDVTLAAAEDFKPKIKEDYPFEVVWVKAKLKGLFLPNALPYCPKVIHLARSNDYDLIISSEVFSVNTLMLAMNSSKKLIIWHELAKHNKIYNSIPSKIWYGIITKLFLKDQLIVPRSIEAKRFISKFCNNVSDEIVDHGVNLEIFKPRTEKENFFVVSSQLIKRKRVDKIIDVFIRYIEKFDKNSKLYIMGDGDEREALEKQVAKHHAQNNIIFTGKLTHTELIDYLSRAKAMLVYTEKDNNMVSIVESIAVGTPIITTSVPYNASYIREYDLGVVSDHWDENILDAVANNNKYIENCIKYRETLSTTNKVKTFLKIYEEMDK